MKETINMDVRRKLVKNMNKTEGGSVLIHISSQSTVTETSVDYLIIYFSVLCNFLIPFKDRSNVN